MSFISILQGGKAAKKLGAYNKDIYDRDAAIERQEKDQAFHFYENFEKPKFEKTADEIRSEEHTSELQSH